MTDALSRISLAVADLTARVARAGQPWNAANEVGTFVEDLHNTLHAMNGGNRTFQVDEWHTVLTSLSGSEVTQGDVQQMTFAYKWRHRASHNNESRYLITREEVGLTLAYLQLGVKNFLRWLQPDQFVEVFLATQTGARNLTRARDAAACIDAGACQALWERIEANVLVVVPPARHGFTRATLPQRLRRALEELAGVSTPGADHLGTMVDTLLEDPSLSALLEWRRRDCIAQHISAVGPPIPSLRLVVGRAHAGTLLIERIDVDGGGIPGWRERLGERLRLPRDLSQERIGVELVRVQEELRALCAASQLSPPRWKEWVLRVEVPDELARTEFEKFKHRGGVIASLFGCVVVCPAVEVGLRSHEAAVEHPDHGSTSTAEWTAEDVDTLRARGSGKECLFSGPNGWKGTDVPALFYAYHDATCAVMIADPDRSAALTAVFQGEAQLSLEKLFDRLSEARREGHDVRIIWDDPRSRSTVAVSP